MRKRLFILSIIALFIYGCEKQEMYQQVHGTWRIFAVSGSIMGSQSIRDFDYITFTQSGKYSVTFRDTIIQGGSFKLYKMDPEKYGNFPADFFMIINESFNYHPFANFYTELPMAINFNGHDTLTLSQLGVSDGFNYHLKF